MANAFDSKRFHYNEIYSQAYGNPDIDVYKERLARGEDVSDFTISNLPHYIPAYFLNQLMDHINSQKYIKIGSNPIFNDDDSTSENNQNIASLLEGNVIPPSFEQVQYSGERRIIQPNEEGDDVRETLYQSKRRDVFPPSSLSNEDLNLSTADIFRRDENAKGGPAWVPFYEKDKFDTLKSYSDNQRKRNRCGSPVMINRNYSRLQPSHEVLEQYYRDEQEEQRIEYHEKQQRILKQQFNLQSYQVRNKYQQKLRRDKQQQQQHQQQEQSNLQIVDNELEDDEIARPSKIARHRVLSSDDENEESVMNDNNDDSNDDSNMNHQGILFSLQQKYEKSMQHAPVPIPLFIDEECTDNESGEVMENIDA